MTSFSCLDIINWLRNGKLHFMKFLPVSITPFLLCDTDHSVSDTGHQLCDVKLRLHLESCIRTCILLTSRHTNWYAKPHRTCITHWHFLINFVYCLTTFDLTSRSCMCKHICIVSCDEAMMILGIMATFTLNRVVFLLASFVFQFEVSFN